jgi:hypothetical protein
MQYSIVNNNGFKSMSAFIDGQLYTAVDSHPRWDAIVEAAENGTLQASHFDLVEAVTSFLAVTDRMSLANGKVYFDGDHVDNTLTKQIVKAMTEGSDAMPFVNFMEKLATNPLEATREQLFDWINASDYFTIDQDGDIIGYKSVHKTGENEFHSISSGSAVVNGVPQVGRIVQSVGSVITMPRADVQHDPAVGCSTGLHVGTWEYAESFYGDAILSVAVNPRDVVSVPTECDAQKMRVCRYTVIGSHVNPNKNTVAHNVFHY